MKNKSAIVAAVLLVMVAVTGLVNATWHDNQPASSGIKINTAFTYTRNNLMHIYNAVIENYYVYLSEGTYYAGFDVEDTSNTYARNKFIVSSGAPTTDYTKQDGDSYVDSSTTPRKLGIYNSDTGSFEYISTGAAAGVSGIRYIDNYTTPTYSFADNYVQFAAGDGIEVSQATSGVITTITKTAARGAYDIYNIQAAAGGDTYPPGSVWYGSNDQVGAYAIQFDKDITQTALHTMTIPSAWDVTQDIILYADIFVESSVYSTTETFNLAVDAATFTLPVSITFSPYGLSTCSTSQDPYEASSGRIQTYPITLTAANHNFEKNGSVCLAIYRQAGFHGSDTYNDDLNQNLNVTHMYIKAPVGQ